MLIFKNKKIIFLVSVLLTVCFVSGLFFFTFPETNAKGNRTYNTYDHVVRDSILFDKFENLEKTSYNGERTLIGGLGFDVSINQSTRRMQVTSSSVQTAAQNFPFIGAYARGSYEKTVDLTGCDTFRFSYYFDHLPDDGTFRINLTSDGSDDGFMYNLNISNFRDNNGTITLKLSDFSKLSGTNADWTKIKGFCFKWASNQYTAVPLNTSLTDIHWEFDNFHFYKETDDLPLIESFDSGFCPNTSAESNIIDDLKYWGLRNCSYNAYPISVMQGTGALVFDTNDVSVNMTNGVGPSLYVFFFKPKDLSSFDTFELEFLVTTQSDRNSEDVLRKGFFELNFCDDDVSIDDGYNFTRNFTVDGSRNGSSFSKDIWYTLTFKKSNATKIFSNSKWNHITGLRISYKAYDQYNPSHEGFNFRLDDLRGDSSSVPRLTDFNMQTTYGTVADKCSATIQRAQDGSDKTYDGQASSLKVNFKPAGSDSTLNFKLPSTKNLSEYSTGNGYLRLPIYCDGSVPESGAKFTVSLTSHRYIEDGYVASVNASELVPNSWAYVYFKLPSSTSESGGTYFEIRQIKLVYSGSSNRTFYLGDFFVVNKSQIDSSPVVDSMSNLDSRVGARSNSTVTTDVLAPAYGSFVPGYNDGGKALGIISPNTSTIPRMGTNHYINTSAFFYFQFPFDSTEFSSFEIDLYSSQNLRNGTVEFNFVSVDHPSYQNGYDFKKNATEIKQGWNKLRFSKFPEANANKSVYCDGYQRADWSRIYQICFTYYQIDSSNPDSLPTHKVDFYIDTVVASNYHYENDANPITQKISTFSSAIKDSIIDFSDHDSETSLYKKYMRDYEEIHSAIETLNAKWEYYNEDISKGKFYKYHTQFAVPGMDTEKVYPPAKSNDGYAFRYDIVHADMYAKLEQALNQLKKATAISVQPSKWSLGKHYNVGEITGSTVLNVTEESAVSALFSFGVSYTGTYEDKLMPYLGIEDSQGNISIPKGTSIIMKDITNNDNSKVYYYIAANDVNGWLPYSELIKNAHSTVDTSQKYVSADGISFPASGTTTTYLTVFDFSGCTVKYTPGSNHFISFKLCDNTFNKDNIFARSLDNISTTSSRKINLSTTVSGSYHQTDRIVANTYVNVNDTSGDSANEGKYFNVVYSLKKNGQIIDIPYGSVFKFDGSTCLVRENRYIFAYSSPKSPSVYSQNFNKQLEMDFSNAIRELQSGEYTLCSDVYVSYDNTHPFAGKIFASSSGTFSIIKSDKFSVSLSNDQRILSRENETTHLEFDTFADVADGSVSLEIQEKQPSGAYITKRFTDFADVPSCGMLDGTQKIFRFTTIPQKFNLTIKSSVYSQYTYRFLFKLYNVESEMIAMVPVNVVFTYDGMLYADSSQGGEVSIDW